MTSCLITASRLVILRRRSLSVIGTASFSNVARFFAPGRRPRGFPDWPRLDIRKQENCYYRTIRISVVIELLALPNSLIGAKIPLIRRVTNFVSNALIYRPVFNTKLIDPRAKSRFSLYFARPHPSRGLSSYEPARPRYGTCFLGERGVLGYQGVSCGGCLDATGRARGLCCGRRWVPGLLTAPGTGAD
jgi:hypothetical protein